jgi:drug/metabolite transporter (DMT)-like permease
MNFIGEIAAIVTAICWSFTSIFFTISGSRIGSVAVNRLRLLLALAFLLLAHLLTTGQFLPLTAGRERWFWLGISGFVGFVLGDGMLFQALVVVGTRITMLIMSLVPVIGTLLAWIFLGEKLSAIEILAISIVVGGITLVVADKQADYAAANKKHLLLGLLLAMGGAAGQAVGLILSKKGMAGDFPALSANVIRVSIAATISWLLTILIGKIKYTFSKLADKKALWTVLGGAAFGPFIGVWMSLVAIKYAKIGIASTLMALPPILVLPLVHYIFKEKISPRAITGTIITVAGIALLFLAT